MGQNWENVGWRVNVSDLSGSTNLVDTQTPHFAGEIYKTYLMCAAKIIKEQGGTITAYDGDRIMGTSSNLPSRISIQNPNTTFSMWLELTRASYTRAV